MGRQLLQARVELAAPVKCRWIVPAKMGERSQLGK